MQGFDPSFLEYVAFKSDTCVSVVSNKTGANSLARREASEWVEDVRNNKVDKLVLTRQHNKNMMKTNNLKKLTKGDQKSHYEKSRKIENHIISKIDILDFENIGCGWLDLLYSGAEEEVGTIVQKTAQAVVEIFGDPEEIWKDTMGDIKKTREDDNRITIDNEIRRLSQGNIEISLKESVDDIGEKEEELENKNKNEESFFCRPHDGILKNGKESCIETLNETFQTRANEASSMSEINYQKKGGESKSIKHSSIKKSVRGDEIMNKGTGEILTNKHFDKQHDGNDKKDVLIEDFFDNWMDCFEPMMGGNNNWEKNLERPINNQQIDELDEENQERIYRTAASILLYKEIKDDLKIDIGKQKEDTRPEENDRFNISRNLFKFGDAGTFRWDLKKNLNGIENKTNNYVSPRKTSSQQISNYFTVEDDEGEKFRTSMKTTIPSSQRYKNADCETGSFFVPGLSKVTEDNIDTKILPRQIKAPEIRSEKILPYTYNLGLYSHNSMEDTRRSDTSEDDEVKITMTRNKHRNKRRQLVSKRKAKKTETNFKKGLNEYLRNINIGDVLDEVDYSSDWETVEDEDDSSESSEEASI